MLDFEVALARVESRLDIIPAAAADVIAAAAKPEAFDLAELSRGALRAGTPSIPLVKALTDAVRSKDKSAAGFVHWGATSQDVSDTALILLLKRAQPLIASDLSRAEIALRAFSENHCDTVMLGRTLLEPAPPITLGLKSAGWFAAVRRGHERLTRAFDQSLLLRTWRRCRNARFPWRSGPRCHARTGEGTWAGLPGRAMAHPPRSSRRLDVRVWVITGSLGKIARDISLLMQNEVGEASEPAGDGRGGSSTMPHKRNPIGCAVILAAANRAPGLVSAYLCR